MSMDGDEVATTSASVYMPVLQARWRMSFSLVAITSRSMGRPMRLAA